MNKGATATIIVIIIVMGLIAILCVPGVADFFNSTYSGLTGTPAKKSYDDLESENYNLNETLSEISYRLDELYWLAQDISDNMVPAWSYLTEHDPDNEITMDDAASDLEDASCDMHELMREILSLESMARKAYTPQY